MKKKTETKMTDNKALFLFIFIALGIVFFFGMIFGSFEYTKPKFDFSEQNGGRCSETVIDAFARCTRFEVCGQPVCREEFDDNVTQDELDAVTTCKYWLDRKEDCAFVTNKYNITVPYEMAKERGFKDG